MAMHMQLFLLECIYIIKVGRYEDAELVYIYIYIYIYRRIIKKVSRLFSYGQATLMYWLPYSSHTSHHPSQTPCLPWISYATQNWCSIHTRWSKSSRKHSIRFCCIFASLKHNIFAYRSSKVSDCIFEIHSLWQSGFNRVHSNCCCSCLFEPEIIKIGQSSHKMYSNNILNFPEFTTILNLCTKKSYWMHHVYIYIF